MLAMNDNRNQLTEKQTVITHSQEIVEKHSFHDLNKEKSFANVIINLLEKFQLLTESHMQMDAHNLLSYRSYRR